LSANIMSVDDTAGNDQTAAHAPSITGLR